MALHCRRLANADQHLLGKQLIRADNIFKKKNECEEKKNTQEERIILDGTLV